MRRLGRPSDHQSIPTTFGSLESAFPDKIFPTGTISQDELAFIIQGRKEDLQIATLTEVGIAQAQIDNFKTGVINLIEKTIFSLV